RGHVVLSYRMRHVVARGDHRNAPREKRRIAVAWTVGAHMIPSFFEMEDNYLSTAFRTQNPSFFPLPILRLVAESPDGVVWAFVILFHVSLAASLIASYFGLLQRLGYRVSIQGGFRVDATIGNPTYLAAYLLFHLWILLILMHTYRKRSWALSLYALAFLFELVIVYFTATRGAVIGLAAAGVALAGAVVWKWSAVFPPRSDNHATSIAWPLGRKIAASVFACIIIAPLIFWLARNTDIVQSNQVLRRLTNYSLQEGTIQARFHIWGQSWKGFLERPILGWGQENYYLVFQKYFNPKLWGDEPWFDRSHDIFFDWLIHAGFLGLGAYLTMYAALYVSIIKGIKKHTLPFWSGAVILVALFAHLLQNIFVFDNLNTYLLFFAFFAYGSFLITRQSDEKVVLDQRKLSEKRSTRAHTAAIACAGFVLIMSYYLHIAPIKQSRALIRALIAYQKPVSMDEQIAAFKEALAYNSFGTTETREQIVNIGGGVAGNQRYSNAEQAQYATFAIDEMRKEIERPAKDVKHMAFFGSLLNGALGSNPNYPIEAKSVLEEAVKLSPTKQAIAFELAQHYVLIGQFDAARDVVYRAWKFDPTYHVAAVHTWLLAVVTKKSDIVDEVARLHPITSLSEIDLVRLGEAYRRVEDYQHALPLYEQLVVVMPTHAQYRATFAALLAREGRVKEAREQANEAIKLDPTIADDADNFLRNLR
ncbi:MAG: Uncharacterized protein G01um101470_812, partial [Parcubacteria group bacterium Gr01-1014_70]